MSKTNLESAVWHVCKNVLQLLQLQPGVTFKNLLMSTLHSRVLCWMFKRHYNPGMITGTPEKHVQAFG